jgi:hypothetical protein
MQMARQKSRGFVASIRRSKDMPTVVTSFRASIFGLSRSCAPSTICRRIRPIIIDAVQRVGIRWARPHVFYELLKALSPCRVDVNATGTVITITRRFLTVASIDHCCPHTILRSIGKAMCGQLDTSFFMLNTTTGLTCPLSKIVSVYRSDSPAITSAHEKGPVVPSRVPGQDQPRRESLPCYVNKFPLSTHLLTLPLEKGEDR